MSLNSKLLENLLHEPEGTSLDFKSAQYPFELAEDKQKAELLKDILAFANSWRRTTAYILIGVEEVKSGRSKVVGVSRHLDDASLHQFVNSKTQRPVDFSYQVIQIEGKEVGALEILIQKRPAYLRKAFDGLGEAAVFIRDGSSTRLATPDEIARMGAEEASSETPSFEPKFRIFLVDDGGSELESIETEHHVIEPLTYSDIDSLMGLLKSKFPLETYFGPPNPAEKKARTVAELLMGESHIYTPASDEEIARYTKQEYPKWIKECEEFLRNLHNLLEDENGQPCFMFAAINEGTRPGHDALVHFIAKGDFRICPPPFRDEDEDDDDEGAISLPKPPRPPRGKWSPRSSSLRGINTGLLELGNVLSRMKGLDGLGLESTVRMPLLDVDKRRDPNSFYYKPRRSTTPKRSFSLECEQWRHGTEEKVFIGELFFDLDKEKAIGELTCEVHAENLAVPVKRTFSVEITINRVKTTERARLLIKELAGSAV